MPKKTQDPGPGTRDTEFREPSMTAGETEMLLFSLERARAQFAWKTGGLDSAGLRRRHPPSTMTLGGVVEHLALVEDWTVAEKLTGESLAPPWDPEVLGADPEWEWQSAAAYRPGEPLDVLVERGTTQAAVTGAPSQQGRM